MNKHWLHNHEPPRGGIDVPVAYIEEWTRIEKAARCDPRFRITYAYIKEWAHAIKAAIELEKSRS
jgi:hypothetical protein